MLTFKNLIFFRFLEANAKFKSGLSPSRNKADEIFKLFKISFRAFVFGSFNIKFSTRMILLSLILEDKICLIAKLRVRLGIFFDDLMPLKLCAIPPDLNILAFFEPCLAPPLPFCLTDFWVVPFTSDLFLVLALRGLAFAEFQLTSELIIFAFASRPNIASLTFALFTLLLPISIKLISIILHHFPE